MNDLVNTIERYMEINPAQRRGQASFNVLCNMHPEIAESIRSTDVDPFYDDSRLPAFFAAVESGLTHG